MTFKIPFVLDAAYFKRPVKSREKEAPLVAIVWKVNFDFGGEN